MFLQIVINGALTVKLLLYLANWSLYTPENDLQGSNKHQSSPFPGFARAFGTYCSKKLPEWAPTETRLRVLYDYATTYVGTSMIRLPSIKFSLPSV